MTKNASRLLIVVLFLGLVFDFLFWRQYVGVNFAIFVTLCLAGGFLLLYANGLRAALMSLWLLIPIAFFVLTTFVRREPLTILLAFVFTFFTIGLLTVTFRGGCWIRYGLLDYFVRYIQLGISLLIRPVLFFAQERKERDEIGVEKQPVSLLPIIRGLLIAIPIVIFFTALLTSADIVFNQKIGDFLHEFTFKNILENLYRLFIIVFWSYLIAGIFLHAASQSRDEKLYNEDPVIKPFLGFTEAAIVLGSVIALFLLFTVIQFQYFFGGEVNIGVEGFTYSQYARRGFNELVTVAFFSLLMVLGLGTFARRENRFQKRVYSGLSIGITGLVLIMLVSAYQRLMLAIDWHGYSRLRLYPRVFLVWVGLLLVAVVVIEILRRERFFTFAALLAALGFAISLSVINVDAAIAKHNIWRATQGKHFNVQYLASLSTDAIPVVVDEFLNTPMSTLTHEGVGAAAICYTHRLSTIPADDWRYFTLSRWRADKALAEIQTDLADYRLNDKRTPVRVRTPSGLFFECPEKTPFWWNELGTIYGRPTPR